jgi:uncharacterized cupredoxin-like copper-binding protein
MNHPPFSRAAACAAVAVALAACGSVAAAHGNDDRAAAKKPFDAARVEDTAFGREGDPRKVGRIVRLGMSDALRYTPSSITVRRGETVRFIVHNEGKLLHEMILGTPQDLQAHAELMRKFPGMEHADANMTHVKPGADGEIVWQFTRAGTFQFACLVPGHFEAGMVGKVTVR